MLLLIITTSVNIPSSPDIVELEQKQYIDKELIDLNEKWNSQIGG